MGAILGWIRLWWRPVDNYNQLSEHLLARGIAPFVRAMVSAFAAILCLLALLSFWSGTGPHNDVEFLCVAAACVIAAGCAALWASCWPTRRQSLAFAMLASVAIACAALGEDDPPAALVACATFATIAAYIAAFHTPAVTLFNFVIAAATSAFEVVRALGSYKPLAAWSAFAIILLLIIAVPAGIQVLMRVLTTDAVHADYDPLTALLNRGGFYRRARERIEVAWPNACVAVAMIDLDRFKQLNDCYGHSYGDDALVAVALAIRNAGDNAVIGRVGGEEFAVADLWRPDELQARAQLLCTAIAALPFALTASIGTVALQLTCPAEDSGSTLHQLMAIADAAMYVAKRRGGNQINHCDSNLEGGMTPPQSFRVTESEDRSQ